ncbi:ferritin family protein [Methanohalophilus portucalensis]|uniref:Rubrerythrin n=3 Tax=Methanohalophilus portucalensis TaxID=39664 RepID=A0A1X7N3J7_9EURY|nr:ferritin family protein [Methanohalophilus portucalensis]ATU08718.1 rubrerythrin [Methanohalophilus portucalensis]RNI13107.1 rubrerythrin [Methanohalophilus portucalensis FDF-1]SMH31407.1 Rubrerythrin [Methanohalophilus portucalensis FDF-1]
MLSEIPAILEELDSEDIDKEVLRAAIIAEFDAVNIYEQMAGLTNDDNLRTVLLDIAKEEKLHIAMFQSVLLEYDQEYLEIMADYSLARK